MTILTFVMYSLLIFEHVVLGSKVIALYQIGLEGTFSLALARLIYLKPMSEVSWNSWEI